MEVALQEMMSFRFRLTKKCDAKIADSEESDSSDCESESDEDNSDEENSDETEHIDKLPSKFHPPIIRKGSVCILFGDSVFIFNF